jgi:metal-responsive CopG/Arc/MetJ family transcriptional regulator
LSASPVKKKFKFVGVSVSIREDLLAEIDRVMEKELPYGGRSGIISLMITLGLREWKRQTERKKD